MTKAKRFQDQRYTLNTGQTLIHATHSVSAAELKKMRAALRKARKEALALVKSADKQLAYLETLKPVSAKATRAR